VWAPQPSSPSSGSVDTQGLQTYRAQTEIIRFYMSLQFQRVQGRDAVQNSYAIGLRALPQSAYSSAIS
jgi:hypothetical protein